MQTVVWVLHALNAGQQVVLQHNDGGGVVQACPGQRRVLCEMHVQKVHIHKRNLPLAGCVLEQRRRVDEKVRLDLPPVEHSVHPVHRQEILRERQALQILPLFDEVGGSLLGAVQRDGGVPHKFQSIPNGLDGLFPHTGVFTTDHGAVQHRDGEINRSRDQQRGNAV